VVPAPWIGALILEQDPGLEDALFRVQYQEKMSAVRLVLERMAAAIGLAIAAPVLLGFAVAIAFEDGFPITFRQDRIGQDGTPFRLWKLRSMRAGRQGTAITAGNDPRVTRTGRQMRRYKLDELPQLWNVLRGEMSLIGPRPEVPKFVDARQPVWREVLKVRPGITDLATLVYRNEEQLLAGSSNPEQYYRDILLPQKLALNLEYIRGRSLRSDIKLVLLTLWYSFFPHGLDPERMRQYFAH
jgi:lipopolysaccharide/colanic/teichoic acid biosynthesis glycosyltransferase